jgi:hypothetical protein
VQEDRANGGGTDPGKGNFGTQAASIWKVDASAAIHLIKQLPAGNPI